MARWIRGCFWTTVFRNMKYGFQYILSRRPFSRKWNTDFKIFEIRISFSNWRKTFESRYIFKIGSIFINHNSITSDNWNRHRWDYLWLVRLKVFHVIRRLFHRLYVFYNMNIILNESEDDEIFVYHNQTREDAVKIRKRQVTVERLSLMFNVSLPKFTCIKYCFLIN